MYNVPDKESLKVSYHVSEYRNFTRHSKSLRSPTPFFSKRMNRTLNQSFLCVVLVMREDVNRCIGAVNSTTLESSSRRTFDMINIDYDHSDVIVKMTPYTLLNFLHVLISHLPFFGCLLQSCSYQSLRYSLQETVESIQGKRH